MKKICAAVAVSFLLVGAVNANCGFYDASGMYVKCDYGSPDSEVKPIDGAVPKGKTKGKLDAKDIGNIAPRNESYFDIGGKREDDCSAYGDGIFC